LKVGLAVIYEFSKVIHHIILLFVGEKLFNCLLFEFSYKFMVLALSQSKFSVELFLEISILFL